MKSKQKSGLPREKQTWAIRGISPETRAACQIAARRAGMTIGDWCDRVLREGASNDIQQPQVPAKQLEETLSALVQQMKADRSDRQKEREALSSRLDALEKPFWLRIFGK